MFRNYFEPEGLFRHDQETHVDDDCVYGRNVGIRARPSRQRKGRAAFDRRRATSRDVTAYDENGAAVVLKQALKGRHGVIVFGCLT